MRICGARCSTGRVSVAAAHISPSNDNKRIAVAIPNHHHKRPEHSMVTKHNSPHVTPVDNRMAIMSGVSKATSWVLAVMRLTNDSLYDDRPVAPCYQNDHRCTSHDALATHKANVNKLIVDLLAKRSWPQNTQ